MMIGKKHEERDMFNATINLLGPISVHFWPTRRKRGLLETNVCRAISTDIVQVIDNDIRGVNGMVATCRNSSALGDIR